MSAYFPTDDNTPAAVHEAWATLVCHHSIEQSCCRTVSEAEYDQAINLLLGHSGLGLDQIVNGAKREARSFDLAYEYSVGLG